MEVVQWNVKAVVKMRREGARTTRSRSTWLVYWGPRTRLGASAVCLGVWQLEWAAAGSGWATGGQAGW